MNLGRTPDNGLRGGGKSYGRDHNVKSNDDVVRRWRAPTRVTRWERLIEIGASAVECVHHIRDVHVTLLHLLGLDDKQADLLPRGGDTNSCLSSVEK